MGKVLRIIYDNKEWLFSGVGVTIIAGIIGVVVKKRKREMKISQKIVGKNNKQAGRNIGKTINQNKNNEVDMDITQTIDGDENNQAGGDINC